MGKINVSANVLTKAISGDKESIMLLFQPFVKNETILKSNYFGKLGLWLWGTHSFAAITDTKIVALQIGPFGQIIYQDGDIKHVNSGIIYQPRVLWLYIISFLLCCTIIGILFIPFFVRIYYSFKKSGLVWSIREGIPVYVFASRNRISTISEYWSYVTTIKAGINVNKQ